MRCYISAHRTGGYEVNSRWYVGEEAQQVVSAAKLGRLHHGEGADAHWVFERAGNIIIVPMASVTFVEINIDEEEP